MLDVRARFRRICRTVSEDAGAETRDEPGADDVRDWDWISYVNLIIAVERQLGVRLAIAEMSRLKDAGVMPTRLRG